MTPLNEVTGTVYSNSYGKKNSSSSIAIDKLTTKQEDELLNHYSQLVAESYRGYYVIKLREIGKQEFIRRAERAIKYGRNPQKMFGHLMK